MMNTTASLTVASFKMFLRNRQALFFSLFMPLMILFIFGNINFDRSSPMQLGVVTHDPATPIRELLKRLHNEPSLAISEAPLDAELSELKAGNRAAVIDVPDGLMTSALTGGPAQLTVYVNGAKPLESGMALAMVSRLRDAATLQVAQVKPLFEIDRREVSVHSSRYVDFLLPGVIAMSIMQMSVFSVAFVFAQYKERGILKRLLATPMRPMQFVIANTLTRMTMSVTQAITFIVVGIVMFKVQVAGAYWLLGVTVVLGSLMFLGLGFTISGLARTVESVPVLSNITVLPMMFMGNVFFSNAGMPAWLHALSRFMPITFLSNSLRSVMTDGAGFASIQGNLLGMAAWGAVLITTAALTFRFQKADA